MEMPIAGKWSLPMASEITDDVVRNEERVILKLFHGLDMQEGYRAEFIEGEICVSPPRIGKHDLVLSRIARQVLTQSAVDMLVSWTKGLLLPRGEGDVENHVIPDGVYVRYEPYVFDNADPWMPPDGVEMVSEVTFGKPDRDREVKRRCYAKAGIPLYLFVDRSTRTVSLFGAPGRAAADYGEVTRVPFGNLLPLPQPFSFPLDTMDFV